MKPIVLKAEKVSKKFNRRAVFRDISFSLAPGESLAVTGKNGSGKSTLMKILSGVYQADQGTIHYKGKIVNFRNVNQAHDAGIRIIYQELNLIPHLSVAANIFIGREPLTQFGTLNEKKMNADAAAILSAIYQASKKAWMADILPEDADGSELSPDGRVMEMLSEHTLLGWLEGYLLTGRHGFFHTYEAFAHVIDSMFNQHAKWLDISKNHVQWRAPVASENILLSSTVWRYTV